MKLRYLLALPIIATALMGCDEIEYSDAKPVENPQLEGITMNDFSVTLAQALQNGLNLDALNNQAADPNSVVIDLFTINTLTDALPEGAVVSGTIQFAKDPDFSNAVNVNTTTLDNVVSTTLYDLDYTRSQMYGKDPRPYDIFYRISIYVNVDGGQFKMGLKDEYYNNGNKFVEEGVNPGYYVEEAYYLLGPNGSDVAKAVVFEHSGYNIYDDTVFTCTAVFEGGDTWLVIPVSVYEASMASGTLDTSKCYGPAVAAQSEGELVLSGKPGTVTQGNKYQISINLSTLSYTIEEKPLLEVGDPTDIYLRGAMNNWEALAHYEFLATDNQNVSVMPYVEINAGIEFKVADASWGAINYGSNGSQLELGKEYILEYNAGNLSLTENFVGSIILTKDEEGNYSLLLQPFETSTPGAESGMYVRGGMNNWLNDGLDDAFEFQTTEYKNVWTLDQSIDADTEFKIADADWNPINLGANPTAGAFDETSGTGVLGLVNSGANIKLVKSFNGTLRLVSVNDLYYLFFILD